MSTPTLCHSVRPRLTALLDNELSPDESAAVRAHLANCADCAATCAEYAATLAAAVDYPVEPADLVDSVLDHLTAAPDVPLLLLNEIRALRGELQTIRGEMDSLRRQITVLRVASRVPPRPASSPRLFPFAPSADLPGRD